MQAATIDTLFGRSTEVGALESFLDDIAAGPSTLVLEGDVGAGKTALWRAGVAAARSRPYRVLTSRATEAEASLPFAALGDLLRDVPEAELSQLPMPQATALRIAVLLQ
jgi:predicted ATPase